MGDIERAVQGDKDADMAPDRTEQDEHDGSRTAGTNRDLDESGESKNQGHGHGGRDDGEGGDAGHSERVVTEQDRSDRDLGGPGGP